MAPPPERIRRMEKNMIRLLKASEIECRISTISEKGLSLLLYKDARVDQRILDETFGPFGWKRSHQSIDGNLYCTVEVYDKENGAWVAKQDVGTTGFTEKEKSQASDSFKRACFNWGIGRELYTAPFIWVPAGKADIQKRDGKPYCSGRFSVKAIEYGMDREITELKITDGRGQTVYEWTAGKPAVEPPGKPEKPVGKRQEGAPGKGAVSDLQMESLRAELERTGVAMEAVQDRYKIKRPEQMSAELYGKVMSALAKTKSAGAA